MMLQKWVTIALVIVSFPILTGCWDRLEIEDRATILGLAIDPIEKNSQDVGIAGDPAHSENGGYELTAQIAIPGRIPLGPGGTGGESATQKPVWVVSTQGKTIQDAVSNMQQELADKVFLGHLRVIIINQKLAESTGIGDIQEFFRRNAEIRRLAWLVISKGEASVAMSAAPKLERVPTLYLVGTMDHSVALGKLPNVFLGNFWSALSSQGQEAVLPLIKVKEDKVELEGLAVFALNKMVGSLDPLQTAAYMEITNVRKAGYPVAISAPKDPNHSIILRGTNRKTKIKCHMNHGKPTFDVYTLIEANVLERTGTVNIDTIIPEMESEFEKVLEQGQQKTLSKAQALHSDIFGFGEYVRGHEASYWSKTVNNSRTNWDNIFSTTPVHVHVKVFIRRAGMSAH